MVLGSEDCSNEKPSAVAKALCEVLRDGDKE